MHLTTTFSFSTPINTSVYLSTCLHFISPELLNAPNMIFGIAIFHQFAKGFKFC